MTGVETITKENVTSFLCSGCDYDRSPFISANDVRVERADSGPVSRDDKSSSMMAALDIIGKENIASPGATSKRSVEITETSLNSYTREARISPNEADAFDELQMEIKEFSAGDGELALADLWNGSSEWSVGDKQVEPRSKDSGDKIVYSRKVFIGGLPADVTDEVISEFFTQFGEVTVDWPHREYTRGNIPPNGYAFVLFKNGTDVEKLVSNCTEKVGRLSIMLTKDGQPLKAVQVRPWKVMSQYCIYRQGPISTRYAVFVGGVPRTVTASQLAAVVYQTFGEVLAVTISVENGTRYPKGAARVIFGTREAYTKAIAAHFLKMKFAEQEKDMEVKPFLMENMLCEGCHMMMTNNLCPFLSCLLYLCDSCWYSHHTIRGFLHHTPMLRCQTSTPTRVAAKNVQTCGPRTQPLFPITSPPPLRPLNISSLLSVIGNDVSPEKNATVRFPPPAFSFPPPSTTDPFQSHASRRFMNAHLE